MPGAKEWHEIAGQQRCLPARSQVSTRESQTCDKNPDAPFTLTVAAEPLPDPPHAPPDGRPLLGRRHCGQWRERDFDRLAYDPGSFNLLVKAALSPLTRLPGGSA